MRLLGSSLGHVPLVSADFWTSDHLSERSRRVDAFWGNARARHTRVASTSNRPFPAQVDHASNDKKRNRALRARDKRYRYMARRRRKGHDDSELFENEWLPGINTPVVRRRIQMSRDLELDLPEPKDDDDSDKTSVSSDDGEESSDSDADAKTKKKGSDDGKKKKEPETFMHFNAYSNGKAAARLHPRKPPVPLGVHRMGNSEGETPLTATMDYVYCPVVLHYTNCGFANWKRKYEILTTGHKTADGAFSLKKGGIKTVRSHLAARAIAMRGGDSFDRDMEKFYRTFIMGNECGELAHFAQHGIVVRVDWIAAFLEDLTARDERALLALEAATYVQEVGVAARCCRLGLRWCDIAIARLAEAWPHPGSSRSSRPSPRSCRRRRAGRRCARSRAPCPTRRRASRRRSSS